MPISFIISSCDIYDHRRKGQIRPIKVEKADKKERRRFVLR